MFDQIFIGDVGSDDEYDASLCNRKIGKPGKKTIKETVPFSNVVYDFSKINGEQYWNERELIYVFEIIAGSPSELERKKLAFLDWVMNVFQEEIYDPFIENYHFIGTFESVDEEDDESVEKSTITVTFTAYPYMIANTASNYVYNLEANVEKVVDVINNSSHRITPTFISDTKITVQVGDSSYGISAGTTKSDSLQLEPGNNTLRISSDTGGKVQIQFYEEVF